MLRFATLALATTALLCAGAALGQDADSAAAAKATGVKVSLAPLRLEMDGAQLSTIVQVHNPSEKAIGVQVRAFDWGQENGKDTYALSNDVRVTPAITTIEPGKTQVFRVVRREAPPQGERRYRVAIDQLPDPQAIQSSVSETRIRFTIPLFVDRAAATPAALTWSIRGNRLSVSNAGQQTPRLVNLALADGVNAPVSVDDFALHYVMTGSTLSWVLPGGCPKGPVHLTVELDGKSVGEQVQPVCS